MGLTRKKAGLIAVLITGANIIGKLLGFGKDVLISYHYGASPMTDAIFLAMSIPLLVLGVFTNSTDSAIIPQYSRISGSEGRETADNHFSNIFNSVAIVALVVSVLMFIVPGIFINIFAPGFNIEQRIYSVKFLRIFSSFGFLHVFYCFFSTYNTIYSKVVARAVLSFTTNLLVVMALLINPDPHMRMLSLAYLLGSILSAIIPVISAFKNGYKYKTKHLKLNNEMEKFINIFLPIMGVALLINMNMFVDKFLASSMGEGSISYINYASRLTSIFDSMIVVGLGVIILPILSQSRMNNDFAKFNKNATQVIKLLMIMLLPIMILCMLFSSQIIEVIYMRGAFGTDAVKIVSRVFLIYSPQILFLPMQATLAKIFHSIEDTKTPFYINIISVGTNIILSIVLSIPLGLEGIAIATSISVVLAVLIFIYKTRKLIGWDSSILDLKELLKIVICGIVALIIGRVSLNFVSGSLLEVLVGVGSGVLAYLISFIVLMKKDFLYLWSFFNKANE
ncbi:murein biosynthesis integral membrane protein MurJ [Clostridium sp.]|uniref:murein biosynthesis integral membrane protein MurJ n=1 Tax=Clostridium sp. TaxID=1506 RepID=UPI00262BB0F6|nr:murein biosynthesis integral membrane protein MurJ [Clostridium sp.]